MCIGLVYTVGFNLGQSVSDRGDGCARWYRAALDVTTRADLPVGSARPVPA